MTTASPLIPSRTHYVKHHEYHTLLPTLLLVDDIMTPNKAIYTQPQTSPKQSTFVHPISSPKHDTRTNHHTSHPKPIPQPNVSSPKHDTHHISSPKQSTFSRQTSQSQPPPPPSRSHTHTSSQQSSQPKSSTLHFLSTHHIAPYSTPSCSITLTPFQPCALSDAVEIAVSQFPSLHDLMHTQPNRSVHPSLLPTQVHSQSTPTRYRLHPTHRKTPSLPNLSQQQTSMEPLPISSMWETPQYEKIAS